MEELFKKLNSDRIRYDSFRRFIENNPFKGYEQVGDAYLLRGESDGIWVYFVCEGETEFESLLQLLKPEDKQFALVEDWMLPALLARGELLDVMRCMRLYLPDETAIRPPAHDDCSIRELTVLDTDWMYAHYIYQESAGIDYFKERIEKSGGLGVVKDGQLVGWLLTHDDGALGMLHILDAYRGHGYAELLTYRMCEKLRCQGILPTLAIKPDNAASMGLARKQGFVEDRIIHWLRLK